MNWALFGAIWSVEMVVVFGYLAASGRLFIGSTANDGSRPYSSAPVRVRNASTT